MIATETRAQAAVELLLAAGIVIVIATIAGLIMKGIFNQAQGNLTHETSAVVNQTN